MKILALLLCCALAVLSLPACDEEEEEDDGLVLESDHALVVINASGSTADTAVPTGTLPKLILSARSTALSPPAMPLRKMLKDLPFTGKRKLARSAAAPAVPRPVFKLTHETTTHTFNAFNAEETPITVSATKVYGTDSSKCLIFAQNGYSGFSDWATLGAYFDTVIYPKCTTIFGNPTDVDDNGKIVILYYNMDAGLDPSGILGYFYPVDLYDPGTGPEYTDSNEMEVFYMNTGFGAPDEEDMVRTLAHEFQHMINYGRRVIVSGGTRMDTWIDEGMAEGSEHYVMDTPGASRLQVMAQDPGRKLRNGKALCVWENDDESYAIVYTFMQYCRIQAGGWSLFTDVINHASGDYQGLATVMAGKNSSLANFYELQRGYRMANLLKQPTGIFGYAAENSSFSAIKVRKPTQPISSLQPGGCVYLPVDAATLDGFTPSGNHADIKFFKRSPGE